MDELISTEAKYTQDLESVLLGYKEVMENSFIGHRTGEKKCIRVCNLTNAFYPRQHIWQPWRCLPASLWVPAASTLQMWLESKIIGTDCHRPLSGDM